MAQTTGFVQRLKLTNGLVLAWAYIGPASNNTTLLIIKQPTPLSPDEVSDASGGARSWLCAPGPEHRGASAPARTCRPTQFESCGTARRVST